MRGRALAPVAAGLAAAALLGLHPPTASAREASAAEVRRLASAAAAGDDRALEALRDVDRVGGRAVELGESLRVTGADLRGRLRSLAARPARPASDAAVARREARELLAEDRFHEPSFPRPLRGAFEWIATAIEPAVAAVGGLVDAVASLVPGGSPVGLTLLAVAVLALFAALSSRALRLRSRHRARAAPQGGARPLGPSPSELEGAASDAERNGDLDLALRLTFRAGLLRLDERGAIRLHPALTMAAIARRLDSRDFAELAAAFEEVVYGGRAAAPADVEAQRAGWRRVLREAAP